MELPQIALARSIDLAYDILAWSRSCFDNPNLSRLALHSHAVPFAFLDRQGPDKGPNPSDHITTVSHNRSKV